MKGTQASLSPTAAAAFPPEAVAVPIPVTTYPPLARGIIAFAFLMVAEFFYSWAWNTVDVLRPYIRDSLGLTLTQAGSGYSAQGAGALIGAILIGQLADRFGRRAMLATIMVGYGLTLVAGTLVNSYFAYLGQRFVLGLFLGGIFPVVVGIYVGLFAANVSGRLAALNNCVFSSAISLLGIAGGVTKGDWHYLLLIGGIPPVLLACLAFVLVPATADARHPRGSAKVPVAELFGPGVRRQTLLLAAMTGLNFFGYQAFSGWQTTYLRDVRGLDATALGAVVGWSFAANMAGGLCWGWLGDRFGRRFNALGFLAAAVLIAVYLLFARSQIALSVIGAAYGFMLSASVIWGPWLTELYPPHLKSTAASIFNWGRLVSFFAPLITGTIAESAGLGWTMALASVAFSIAGVIWLSLPETSPRSLLGGGRVRT
jgi:MFS family permease